MNKLFRTINKGDFNECKKIIKNDKTINKDDIYDGYTYLTFTYQFYLKNSDIEIDLDFIEKLLEFGVDVNKSRHISINNYIIATNTNGYIKGDCDKHLDLFLKYNLDFSKGDWYFGNPLEHAKEKYNKLFK